MSDFYLYACPVCHVIVGGWSYGPPYKCPVCGKVNIKEGKSEWERVMIQEIEI